MFTCQICPMFLIFYEIASMINKGRVSVPNIFIIWTSSNLWQPLKYCFHAGKCEPRGPSELFSCSWGAPSQGSLWGQLRLRRKAGEQCFHRRARAKDKAILWREQSRTSSSKETSWVFPRWELDAECSMGIFLDCDWSLPTNLALSLVAMNLLSQ